MKWVVRPTRFHDESTSGYECRFADANGFRSLMAWRSGNGGALLERGVTAHHAVDQETANIATMMLHHDMRVCPLCLMETSYLRAEWDFALLPTCHRHHVRIKGHCDSCGKLLKRGPGKWTRCKCGQEITELALIREAPSEIERLLLAKLRQEPALQDFNLTEYVQRLSLHSLIKLTMLLGSYIAFDKEQRPRKIPVKTDIDVPRKILCSATWVFSNWPENFHQLLSSKYEAKEKRGGMEQVFGYLYVAFYDELQGDEYQFIKTAFEDWVDRNWRAPLTNRHRRLRNAQGTGQQQPATIVSKALSVRRTDLSTWVKSGKLNGTVRPLPSGRNAVLIDLGQEARIAALAHRLDLREASRHLHIPENRLKELLDAGAVFGHRPRIGGSWKIHVSEITRLLSKFSKLPVVTKQGSDHWSLDTVLRTKLAKGGDFAELVRDIFSDVLACKRVSANQHKGFQALLIEKASFQRWQMARYEGMTIPEVANELGIKQEVAYQLLNGRIIAGAGQGRMGRRVQLAEIEKFKATYIWLRDLAMHRKTSPKSLKAKLLDLGIQAVSGPSVDGCRQYLYRKNEVVTIFSECSCSEETI